MQTITEEKLDAFLEPFWHKDVFYRKADVGPGWFGLCYNLTRLLAEIQPDFKIVQIKQKFAGLRYYVQEYIPDFEGQNFSQSKMFKIIQAGEQASYEICELCGGPGKTNATGWLQTLCEECRR